jgi:hypothetical protein
VLTTMASSTSSISGSVSSDGEWVVFSSLESDVVSGDVNGVRDVFARHAVTGDTQRVSVATDGTESNGLSELGSTSAVSAGARRVAFVSDASNLVPGDDNGVRDAFVRDIERLTTVRISVGSQGEEGDAPCSSARVSDDGRFAVFRSPSSRFGHPSTLQQLYLRALIDEQ